MLYNTLTKYPYTVDIYSWTDTGTVNNPTLTYGYDRTVKANISMDKTGRVFLLLPSSETVQIQGRFNNIKDKNGELIIPIPGSTVGQEYQISEREPIMNQFGYRIGLRYWGVKV